MRSHGVSATDLVVLVVAIDDGVKIQTKEALKTAKDSGCNIIVALNKCDKFAGNPEGKKEARARVLAQLVENELVAEDYGGDVMVVETSALAGEGLDELVESIILQADMLELKAAYKGQCEAVVLDANMEKGRGVVADVLVRWGELSVGDSIVVDTMYGKVKAIVDDKGKNVKTAGPSTPVRILGLRTVPTAGQEMLSVETENKAREISERRQRVKDLRLLRKQDQQNAAAGGTVPSLGLVLKADGVGTLEALNKVVTDLGDLTNDINLKIVSLDVGDITRGDVETASTSNAIVLGFNVKVADSTTRSMAKEQDVSIARDNIIYRLEEKLREKMQNCMPLIKVENVDGVATVQQIFKLNNKSKDEVAGLIVANGFLTKKQPKGSLPVGFRVTRQSAVQEFEYIKQDVRNDPSLLEPGNKYESLAKLDFDDENSDKARGIVFREEVINDDTVTIRRFKDIVSTVESGNECGLSLLRFRDWKEGDVVECYRIEHKKKAIAFF
jgi:translation initiation factor IF-2